MKGTLQSLQASYAGRNCRAQLAAARNNAEERHVMEARQASDNIREKYGL